MTTIKMYCKHCKRETTHILYHDQYWRCSHCHRFAHYCNYDCLKQSVTRLQQIPGPDGRDRQVCGCCVNHPQADIDDALDCKNEFWVGGRCVGQCGCYSLVHGERSK